MSKEKFRKSFPVECAMINAMVTKHLKSPCMAKVFELVEEVQDAIYKMARDSQPGVCVEKYCLAGIRLSASQTMTLAGLYLPTQNLEDAQAFINQVQDIIVQREPCASVAE